MGLLTCAARAEEVVVSWCFLGAGAFLLPAGVWVECVWVGEVEGVRWVGEGGRGEGGLSLTLGAFVGVAGGAAEERHLG